jgi:hypothetical protein
MPAGSHGKTSTIFYRRGVPDSFKEFGALAAGNYPIFQPSGRPDIRSDYFKKSMSTFIATTR